MKSAERPPYLTKSRFKLAMECPTKLFYTGKHEYANQKKDDPFLEALADGGYQVGELAKLYYPGGKQINALNHEEAEKDTKKLLNENEDIVIFEAAIRHNNLFVLVDILEKIGNRINLIEVKAKSYDDSADKDKIITEGKINSKWKPYLLDVAFQTHVVACAYEEFTVNPFLLLVNKKSTCETDGLNRIFKIEKSSNNRKYVVIRSGKNIHQKDTKELLTKIDVKEIVDKLLHGKSPEGKGLLGLMRRTGSGLESYQLRC